MAEQWSEAENKAAKKYDTAKKENLRNTLAQSAEKARSAQAKEKGLNPEALAAVRQLDTKQLEALRQKLAGIEVPKKFPEGTGEIELTEEDLEEIN